MYLGLTDLRVALYLFLRNAKEAHSYTLTAYRKEKYKTTPRAKIKKTDFASLDDYLRSVEARLVRL